MNIGDYLEVISAKTAELFAASCQVGAVVAKGSLESQQAMYSFGLNLGIAFQIIDDVLDYMASQIDLGKNIGNDFSERKVTLPIIIAYHDSNETEKAFWQRIICSEDQQPEDFTQALAIFAKYEVITRCLAMAEEYTQKAKEDISIAPDNQIKTALIDILNFSISRNF